MKPRPKIVSIVGARPQFIKLAPLARAFSTRFRHAVIHTGQHYDDNMSQTFFRQLRLPRPRMNLGISGGKHGVMTGRMLSAIEKVLLADQPDFVVVYGDTNSTLAGALAAAKLSIPVGHVEAGMRSFVDDMPEEINRRLTDHLARLHFCPTEVSMKNLRAEGIRRGLLHSGDLMYELLHDSKSTIRANKKPLRQFGLTPGEFLLITAHRAANVDRPENLQRLVELLEALPFPTLFPVHPRTRKRFVQANLLKRLRNLDNLILCEPLSYLDTLTCAMQAHAVLTDSGGLQ
ncbi:MAG: UDP-N-acetylglucosamine 2-epimerase (non-hydrolyzing), partial [candidate division Zixibacteria bacterium]|nr:UDP-N-acetylglucosamine 2-epimerase (non-hydrolyzing) [candidate division Zixibacteria bacterium]